MKSKIKNGEFKKGIVYYLVNHSWDYDMRKITLNSTQHSLCLCDYVRTFNNPQLTKKHLHIIYIYS